MREIAKDIFRQRLIIEGETRRQIVPNEIEELLVKLCDDLNMVKLTDPTLSFCDEYGWCGHMHWVTSGVHMYTWANRTPPFFSIDIYTCKPFSARDAVDTVCNFLGDNLTQIVWKDV